MITWIRCHSVHPVHPENWARQGNWLCWRDFQLGANLCESLQETIRNYRFVNPTDPKALELIWETNIFPQCAYHSGASNSSHTARLIGKRSEFWLAWIPMHARLLTHFPRILCALICSSMSGEYARHSPYLHWCQFSNQCNQCRTHWLSTLIIYAHWRFCPGLQIHFPKVYL